MRPESLCIVETGGTESKEETGEMGTVGGLFLNTGLQVGWFPFCGPLSIQALLAAPGSLHIVEIGRTESKEGMVGGLFLDTGLQVGFLSYWMHGLR